MKRIVVLLGMALVALLPASISFPSPVSAAASGSILRMAIITVPQTLDPALVSQVNDVVIVQQIFDGLTQLDRQLHVIPAIASSWSSSSDGKTWTFQLRQDVQFHNGRQVKAGDFVYSWNRAKSMGGVLAILFDRIATFTAPSDFTFVVDLTKPDVTFPTKVSLPPFLVVPSEATATLGTNPIGAGAFKFVSWTPASKIVLEQNLGYYDDAPSLAGVEFKVYSDLDSAWADFQAGNVDVTQIPTSQWNVVKSDSNVITDGFFMMMGVGIDNAAFPDMRVRQAIQRAIDRAAIVANPVVSRYDPVQLATGVVLPDTDSYSNSDIRIPYNPVEALRLLAAAGWSDTNGDGILDNGAGVNLQITINAPVRPFRHAIAQAIANNLSNIGGTGVGAVVTLGTPGWNDPGTNLHLIGWDRDWPNPGGDLWPYVAANRSLARGYRYSSPAFDAYYDDALANFSTSKRNELYHAAEVQLIINDATELPIFYDRRTPIMKKPNVRGLEFTGTYDLSFSFKSVKMTK